jgi:hypothetical protein
MDKYKNKLMIWKIIYVRLLKIYINMEMKLWKMEKWLGEFYNNNNGRMLHNGY